MALAKKIMSNKTDATGWNLSNATISIQRDSVVTEETQTTGLFFKPDGTKMYIVGTTSDQVREYNLSTAWDLTTATYLQGVSVNAQEGAPTDVFFKPDGTKMYIVGTLNDQVREYDLSTAWNVTTATYLQGFSVAGQDATPQSVFFKPDGLKMYVVGSTSDQVREYNLSTAWNVTTASYLQGFSVSTQDGSPGGLFFKPDGTKMYIVGTINDQVREYNLSTAWNVTTASYLQGFSVLNFSAISAREEAPQAVFFKDDGTEMFIVGTTANTVLKFNLTTAWNITTSTVPNYFYVGNQDLVPGALFFKPDGLKMYVVGAGQDQVREYNLSTAWDISTASYLQGFSVAVEESTPTGLFFRSDGLKMYVVGITNDQVREYNLSTAWNVTTASYLQGFSVAGQDTNPQGLFFKPDGLKMYVVGSTNDQVREYNLSTAWNVTTASYLQGFSVGGQDTFPSGVSFKDDGTKMYIVGLTSDQVREYNLSTAWNVTTATYVQGLSVSNLDTDSQDLFFKPDGTKLYIIGSSSDSIYCYSL